MNLTFKGFLRSYCRELTGLKTDNLKALCNAADTIAPSAAEAVMVFAAIQGKENYLLSLSKKTWMQESYSLFVQSLENYNSLEDCLRSQDLSSRYRKVWDAFAAKKEAIKTDRRVIRLMREKTIEAMKSSGITAYAICKALKLNMGNTYAYLNKGDVSKVSRATARKIMQFACGLL